MITNISCSVADNLTTLAQSCVIIIHLSTSAYWSARRIWTDRLSAAAHLHSLHKLGREVVSWTEGRSHTVLNNNRTSRWLGDVNTCRSCGEIKECSNEYLHIFIYIQIYGERKTRNLTHPPEYTTFYSSCFMGFKIMCSCN